MKRFDFPRGAHITIEPRFDGKNNRVVLGVPTTEEGETITSEVVDSMINSGFSSSRRKEGDFMLVSTYYNDRNRAYLIVDSLAASLRYKEGFYGTALDRARRILHDYLDNVSLPEFIKESADKMLSPLMDDYGKNLAEALVRRLGVCSSLETCQKFIFDAARGQKTSPNHTYPLLEEREYIQRFLRDVREFAEQKRLEALPTPSLQFVAYNDLQLNVLRDELHQRGVIPFDIVQDFCTHMRGRSNFAGVGGVLMGIYELSQHPEHRFVGIIDASSTQEYKLAMRTFKPEIAPGIRFRD